ncbi:PTS transporter subunit EIIC [Paenibacillus sp. N1-5-1-14]|uniref:PTS transporter subunit EIIC n=1 Tax=Paenibacillus radicibacter TaxID=2972488 RepID=UPI002158E053|nr:PTS transporter subunit EIIC [Paenibacillus radicibacter]MCR8641170.1 PTS transporter subunit EIIC [Paenibacillus radicibacter]
MNQHRALAQDILIAVGGASNIKNFTNCMTRLRLNLIDQGLIDVPKLKSLKGVLGLVDDETYQIILGPGVVKKVTDELADIIESGAGAEATPQAAQAAPAGQDIKAELKKKNNTPFKNFLRKIGNIFIPMIPALVGAGLINGIAGLLKNLMTTGYNPEWLVTLHPIISVIGSAFFMYLTVFAGVNAAKEFGGTPALGGAVSAIIIAPSVATISYTYPILGQIKLNPGQGGIIGAIFAAILICYVEKWVRKRMPASLDIIITPTIALLVSGLVTIFVFMPLAGFISGGIGELTTYLLANGGPVSGFILAASFLPLVLFGLHQALIPIHAELITQVGYTALLPILAMAGAGQVGAAIAIYFKLNKNKRMRSLIKGVLPVGFLGIGEPLIYGVSLPLGRPFITACLGGGFGGIVLGLYAMAGNFIGSLAIGPSGLVLVPLVTGPLGIGASVVGYLAGIFASYIAGFLLTYFFGFTKALLLEHNKDE